jgi:hypothetical protein
VIFLKSQETFIKSQTEKDMDFHSQLSQIQEQKRSQDKREQEINQRQEMIKSLLTGKDDEIESLKETER